MFQDDNEKNIEKVLIKYAKDMSSMCNIIANLVGTAMSEKIQELDIEERHGKLLCLIHKAFLETTGLPKDISEAIKVANRLTETIKPKIRRKIKEEGDDEDKVDIDRMIKNAGLKKGGAEA